MSWHIPLKHRHVNAIVASHINLLIQKSINDAFLNEIN